MVYEKETIFVFCSMLISWDFCSSASLLPLKDSSVDLIGSVYRAFWMHGIHLPILLNMDLRTKNGICDDILESDVLQNKGFRKITSKPIHQVVLQRSPFAIKKHHFVGADVCNQPICPVRVQPMSIKYEENSRKVSGHLSEIMMACLAIFEDNQAVLWLTEIFVSYAYRSQSFYISRFIDRNNWEIFAFGDSAARFLPMTQEKLEEYYLSFRNPIEKIRESRPKLIETIEKNGPLRRHLEWKRIKICLSVLSLQFYKEKSITYNIKDFQLSQLQLVPMLLEFRTPGVSSIRTENIVCNAKKGEETVYIYLTHSYNDEKSVFAQRMQGDHLFLELYVRDIPTMNYVINESTKQTFDFMLL